MNRVAVLLFAAVLVIAVYAIVAFAQPGMMGGGGAMAGSPEEMGLEPMDEAMGMGGTRAGPMTGRAAIAVSGNNVFVISGDLLLKYDQDLNLVQQAELPVPGQGMGRGGRAGGGRGGGRGMRGGGGGW